MAGRECSRWRGKRAEREACGITGCDSEFLVTIFTASRDIDRRFAELQLVAQIEIEHILFLRIAARVEFGWRIGPKRSVDRVANEEVDFVLTIAIAQVEIDRVKQLPTKARSE